MLTCKFIACLDSLAFSMMVNRQQNIQEALTDTCDWFYQSMEYKHWCMRDRVDEYRGLLWVKGKPGSGKSTLMKDAFLRTEQLEVPNATVAGFFFNGRGSTLEKTPLGLFQAIIRQICYQDEVILAEFLKLYQRRKVAQISDQKVTWARPELESFLKQVFKRHKPRRTIIFCDALDECDENTVREVVYLFAEICATALASGLDLNVCLSSRHYPTISIDNCPEVVVEAANQADIISYVRDRFSLIEKTDREILMKLEPELIEKAAGVFLWAALVIDLLLRDLDTGQPIEVLTRRLHSVPSRMEDLYCELCSNLKTEERQFSIRLIQWVLLADGMDIRCMCLAVLLSQEWTWQTLASWGYTNLKPPSEKRLVKYIRNASRGLIDYSSYTNTVQFIHETTREFFLTGKGLKLVDPALPDPPLAYSHMLLLHGSIEILENANDWSEFTYIGEYCRRSIYEHALKAEEHGGSSIELLNRLECLHGEEPAHLLRDTLDLRENESILHFFTRKGLVKCVEACLHRGDNVEGIEGCNTPLLTAVSREVKPCIALVSLLLDFKADVNTRGDHGNTPFLVSLGNVRLDFARMLLDHGANPHATNLQGEGALHILIPKGVDPALRKGIRNDIQRIMLELIEGNIDIEARTDFGLSPLYAAIISGNVEAVKKLAIRGVNLQGREREKPPILEAVQDRRIEGFTICKILLQHGANITYKDRRSRTLLHHAANFSTVGVVKLLIDSGAEVNATDHSGYNALHYAAERMQESTDVIRTLVDAGCSVTAQDCWQRTPLQVRYSEWPQMNDDERRLLSGQIPLMREE